MYDRDSRALAGLLSRLGELDENLWLKERATAYVRQHANDPQSWPPPTALDWLYVDLGDPGDPSRWPLINVPPFSFAPGETRGPGSGPGDAGVGA